MEHFLEYRAGKDYSKYAYSFHMHSEIHKHQLVWISKHPFTNNIIKVSVSMVYKLYSQKIASFISGSLAFKSVCK